MDPCVSLLVSVRHSEDLGLTVSTCFDILHTSMMLHGAAFRWPLSCSMPAVFTCAVVGVAHDVQQPALRPRNVIFWCRGVRAAIFAPPWSFRRIERVISPRGTCSSELFF